MTGRGRGASRVPAPPAATAPRVTTPPTPASRRPATRSVVSSTNIFARVTKYFPVSDGQAGAVLGQHAEQVGQRGGGGLGGGAQPRPGPVRAPVEAGLRGHGPGVDQLRRHHTPVIMGAIP